MLIRFSLLLLVSSYFPLLSSKNISKVIEINLKENKIIIIKNNKQNKIQKYPIKPQ